jgi:hypothetical protein
MKKADAGVRAPVLFEIIGYLVPFFIAVITSAISQDAVKIVSTTFGSGALFFTTILLILYSYKLVSFTNFNSPILIFLALSVATLNGVATVLSIKSETILSGYFNIHTFLLALSALFFCVAVALRIVAARHDDLPWTEDE